MSIKNESELRVWRSECRRRRKSRVRPGAFINKVKPTVFGWRGGLEPHTGNDKEMDKGQSLKTPERNRGGKPPERTGNPNPNPNLLNKVIKQQTQGRKTVTVSE